MRPHSGNPAPTRQPRIPITHTQPTPKHQNPRCTTSGLPWATRGRQTTSGSHGGATVCGSRGDLVSFETSWGGGVGGGGQRLCPLNPTPYTLHHTPYTLHPAPMTSCGELSAPPPMGIISSHGGGGALCPPPHLWESFRAPSAERGGGGGQSPPPSSNNLSVHCCHSIIAKYSLSRQSVGH